MHIASGRKVLLGYLFATAITTAACEAEQSPCGERKAGESCDPDSCQCADVEYLMCTFENGYGAGGDYICVDTTLQDGQVGEPCTFPFECASGYCYRTSEGGPVECQADCLDEGEPLYGSWAGACCNGAATNDTCL
jgi:hypothetical protein